jgi:hypothetical protein
MLPSPMNAMDFMSRPPAPRIATLDRAPPRDERIGRAARRASPASLQRRPEATKRSNDPAAIAPPMKPPRAACYNPAARMIGLAWIVLVLGTLLGVVSLTADLVGIGAFKGFGWKQALGTVVALCLVVASGWRIFLSSRDKR